MACDFARQAAARVLSRRDPGTETYSIIGTAGTYKSPRSSLFILGFTFLGFGCCNWLSSLARVVATLAFVVLGCLVLWWLGLLGLQSKLASLVTFPGLGRLG